MIYALVGLIVGAFAGIYFDFSIPSEFIKYTAVIILGVIDSLIGAWKAEVRGSIRDDKYNPVIFLTGLFSNVLFASLITFLGEHLGLDLYLAVTVVFTIRIFTNLGKIRRVFLNKYLERKKRELIKIEFFRNI
jgi:small basic protein